MKRKNIILFTVLTAFLLIVVVSFVSFSGTKNQVVGNGMLDNGYQIASDNKLMVPLNVEIGNSGAIVKGAYYDGLRVYLDIHSSDVSNIDVSKTILLNGDGNELTVDEFLEKDESTFVLIWNDCLAGDNIILQLAITDGTIFTSLPFQVNTIESSVFDVDKYFEELYIDTITSATTSTLFDVEVYTLLGIEKFQIEVNDEVRTSVSILKNENSYSILFPTVVDADESVIIHALDASGNILMSIPVDMEFLR